VGRKYQTIVSISSPMKPVVKSTQNDSGNNIGKSQLVIVLGQLSSGVSTSPHVRVLVIMRLVILLPLVFLDFF